jgi:pyocin large subunit-like protein
LPSSRLVRLVIFALLLTAPAFAATGRGFRTQHLLTEHFQKHGREFGPITQDQYLRLAQQLRDARPGKNILVARRPDGGGSKFDRRHSWFVAYDGDGTLRTFFVPNEGIRYFERQARTYVPPE